MAIDETREIELRKIADVAAQLAAEKVLKVAAAESASRLATAAAAADQLTLTAAHAAQSLSEATKIDLGYIREELQEIKTRLDNKYVTLELFSPIKALVYGQVALILIGVVGGLLALVLRK
jgi:Cu/Ag efflux protein CusF